LTPIEQLGGWRPNPAEVGRILSTLRRPQFATAAPQLSGSGTDRQTLLYKAFKDVNGGQYIPYAAQAIGDCVSFGHGHGVDLLEAVQIAIGKSNEVFKPTCTEAVYGMARVDIGGEHSYSDGAVGAWAAKAISTLGTVNRDLTGPYDGQRAKAWGHDGVPGSIKSAAVAHKVKTVSLVSTYAELEDALANGYPVTVCSDQGFTLTRDSQGFCRARGSWSHCMLITGTRTDRPGACIFQSWGPDMPTGPLDLDQPPNSFWAERDVVASMLDCGDSWALSGFDGYPGQVLPENWDYGDMA
jgi:hypothetical protein